MTGNQLDVIIDNKPIHDLLDSGQRFLSYAMSIADFHDVILGWDFLEASKAVIDCGQNVHVLKDICRDSTAPDA
ncbi:hypothetical protein TNCV_2259311 [Trichonephila clavipes]|nr:hypothetical protein TNCV_2259311 [Trichonephila clavipes]